MENDKPQTKLKMPQTTYLDKSKSIRKTLRIILTNITKKIMEQLTGVTVYNVEIESIEYHIIENRKKKILI